jgi:hypothetical protein
MAPAGTIEVDGSSYPARSERGKIAAGSRVVVTGFDLSCLFVREFVPELTNWRTGVPGREHATMSMVVTIPSGRQPLCDLPKQVINKSRVKQVDGRVEYDEITIYTPGQDDEKYRPAPVSRREVVSTVLKATLIILVGFACAGIPLSCFAVHSGENLGRPQKTSDSFLALSSLVSAMFLIRIAAKYCADRLSLAPPVVFLRSHSDDHMSIKKGFFDPEPLLGPNTMPGQRRSEFEVEEVLHEELKYLGRTVSIAPPAGEAYSKNEVFRFARYRTAVEDWQEAVLEALMQARLVAVLLPAEWSLSDPRWGVGWELDTLRKIDRPEKVVVVIPPHDRAVLEARWKALHAFGERIGIDFPAAVPDRCSVCLFSKEWIGTVVSHATSEKVGGLRHTLRNVVIDPDRGWRRRRRGLTAFALTTCIVFIGFMVYRIFLDRWGNTRFIDFAATASLWSLSIGTVMGILAYFAKSVF